MNILITGGAGFLGRGLATALLQRGQLGGRGIERLMLADLVAPQDPALVNDERVSVSTGDLLAHVPALMADGPWDAVFHLASAVSGECEANFDLGLHANLDSTRALLDACRVQTASGHAPPMFFFSSSVAVFGSDPAISLPGVVLDNTLPTPQSSYGIHKFVCEQLVADYTRKGFIDGRAARLMTVSVRPGRPNGAASGFLSGLFREPLAGEKSNCPVSLDTEVAIASPATTIAGILAVAEASRETFGGRTAINLPALTVCVRDMLTAFEALCGPDPLSLLSYEPDANVAKIVAAWPSRFDSQRAPALGLVPDPDFGSVLRQYVQHHADAVTHPDARARLGLV